MFLYRVADDLFFVHLGVQTKNKKSYRRKFSLCVKCIITLTKVASKVASFLMTGPAQNGYVDVNSLPAQSDFVDINDETLPDALPASLDGVTSYPVGNIDHQGLQHTSFVSAPG